MIGLTHSALSYRLAYQDFADFVAQTISDPGSPLVDPAESEYGPGSLLAFAKLAFQSLSKPLHILALSLAVLGWALCFRAKRLWINAAWSTFFIPLLILPPWCLLTGAISINFVYLLSAVLPLMAGIALLFHDLLFVRLSTRSALVIWGSIALGLAARDGIALKGAFEVNPPESSGSMQWTSDSRVVSLVRIARDRSKRPMVLLTNCDLIPLMIDVSSFVSKFVLFSETSVAYKTDRYLRDCMDSFFKKRSVDVVLSENPNPVATIVPDIIYTTVNELGKLAWEIEFDIYFLRAGRVLLVRKLAAAGPIDSNATGLR